MKSRRVVDEILTSGQKVAEVLGSIEESSNMMESDRKSKETLNLSKLGQRGVIHFLNEAK